MSGAKSLILATLFLSIAIKGSAQLNIVTIGDSHGAQEMGWVNQLKKIRPQDSILNFSIGGNTLGFDNLGRTELNELKNVDKQLKIAGNIYQKIDYIIVMLGTNDCKAVFDSFQEIVPQNLEKIIKALNAFTFQKYKEAKIILVTPPPIASDDKMAPKYHGAADRLDKLLPKYFELAQKYHCVFIDAYTYLLPDFSKLNTDGIHLTEFGYREIAIQINGKMM